MNRTKGRKTSRRSKHKFTGPLDVNTNGKSMLVANWEVVNFWA